MEKTKQIKQIKKKVRTTRRQLRTVNARVKRVTRGVKGLQLVRTPSSLISQPQTPGFIYSGKQRTKLSSLKQLQQLAGKVNTPYLKALVCPEFAHNAKIPALYPLPTLSCIQRTTIAFTTNTSGNAAVLINPWFLSYATNVFSWILINNDNNLDLNGAGTSFFNPRSMVSKVPNGDIAAYRLVSASVRCYSAAAAVNRGGIIKGGIFTRTDQVEKYPVSSTGNNPFGGNAGIASVIDQAMYCVTANVTDGEMFRAIYMPFDPTFEMFLEPDTGRGSAFNNNCDDFFWNFYVRGPASQPMVLEICWNWEMEPKQESFTQLLVSKSTENNSAKDKSLQAAGNNDRTMTQAMKDSGVVEKMSEKLDEAHMNGIQQGNGFMKAIGDTADTVKSILKLVGLF
jgi:hypothetical protein